MKTSGLRTFALICMLLILGGKTQATHSLASDIAWEQVGKDTFLVTFTYYRDCNGVPAGNQDIVFKCSTTSSTITTQSFSVPSPIDVTPTCYSTCNRCQSLSCNFPIGIEKYIYIKTVILSSAGSCCEITISTTASSRSTNITTGAASQGFYTEAKMNRCLTAGTNSPVSNTIPALLLCVGQDLMFKMNAKDNDLDTNGKNLDSLSYEWAQPLSAASSPISYSGNYTYEKPVLFWGFPNDKLPFPRGIHLDQTTGDISFRPFKVESSVAVVKIGEWRKINGIMINIGYVRKEFWFCIISCPSNNSPVLGGPFYKEVCAGDTVSFSITTNDYDTKDSLKITWNKSIPNATWTDNNDTAKHPTGQFIWKTELSDTNLAPYVFTANVKDNACPVKGSSTRAFQILVSNKPKATFTVTNQHCGNYLFTANKVNPSFANCLWNGVFSPGFSLKGNPITYQFDSAGKFHIQLELGNVGCKTIYDTTITVDSIKHQVINFSTFPVLCSNSSPLILSTYAIPSPGTWSSYSKAFVSGDSLFPSKGIIGKNKLLYQVLDSFNCISNDSTEIEILDLPIVDAGNDDIICPDVASVPLSGIPIGGSWSGKGVSGSTFVPKDAKPGSHLLIYSYNNGNCSNSDSIMMVVTPFADTNLNRNGDSIFAATGMKSYLWFCNDTLVANQTAEKIRMHKAGSFYAMIEDSNGCSFKTKIISGTLGINDIFEYNLTITPNPAHDFLIIDYVGNRNKFNQIRIANTTGNTLISINSPVFPVRVNTSSLSEGIYFIKVIGLNGTIDKKIIIR